MAIPSGKKLEEQEAVVRPKDVLLDNSIDVDEQRKEPTPTKPQFTFYESLPKMEVVISEDDTPDTHKEEADTCYKRNNQPGSYRSVRNLLPASRIIP